MKKRNDRWTKLNRRVSKARSVVNAGMVHYEKDVKKGRGRIVWVPSATVQGRVYKIKLVMAGNRTILATCWAEDALGSGKCLGNSNGQFCWHVLAAILFGGKKVKFYSTQRGADLTWGEVYQVVSGNGPGKMWMVIG